MSVDVIQSNALFHSYDCVQWGLCQRYRCLHPIHAMMMSINFMSSGLSLMDRLLPCNSTSRRSLTTFSRRVIRPSFVWFRTLSSTFSTARLSISSLRSSILRSSFSRHERFHLRCRLIQHSLHSHCDVRLTRARKRWNSKSFPRICDGWSLLLSLKLTKLLQNEHTYQTICVVQKVKVQ